MTDTIEIARSCLLFSLYVVCPIPPVDLTDTIRICIRRTVLIRQNILTLECRIDADGRFSLLMQIRSLL